MIAVAHSSVEDAETRAALTQLSEINRMASNRVSGVKTVLVVLSSKAMPFDVESLRQKILMGYPDSAVFFETTSGKAIGVHAPKKVDLLIDLTGPWERQWFTRPKKLRRQSRVAIGRNAGFFGIRKRCYDKVYDEKKEIKALPPLRFDRERLVQTHVLALAGIVLVPVGDATVNREKSIAFDTHANR